ncbi:MAG: glycosyltransferase family 2 protein [Bdellovibrionaceae bacterium]|nr:glycosyltransferase family 2 protein [Pseudobdellovibrionaceae bacterium]
MQANTRPVLSIVLPIYNEEENILPLLLEIAGVLRPAGLSYEVLAVDDGSRDGSLQVLKEATKIHPELRVFRFWKNAGQSAAFDAGFRSAQGQYVVTMDADRQNDPRDILRLLAKMEEGYDFVTGWRKNRQDGFFLRTFPSKIANFIIRKVTRARFRDLGCSLKMYRREITDRLYLYGEMHRFISVLVEMLGARVAEMEVNHRPRVAGVSKYNLSRTFKVMFDLMTIWFFQRFQTKPIYIFGAAGAFSMFVGLVLCGFVLYQKFFLDVFVHRNPLFIIAAFSVAAAAQFLFMGIIAEVLMRTYFESQNRRPYAIREEIRA